MKLFETNLTKEIVSSNLHGEQFIENDTCTCVFYIDQHCIYATSSGRYYTHEMPKADREFFHYGQVERIANLEPMDLFYEQQLATISEETRNLEHYGVSVVEIEVDKRHPDLISFFLYLAEQSVYLEIDLTSRAHITQATVEELVGLDFSPNTLDKAYYVAIADDGSVDMEVTK